MFPKKRTVVKLIYSITFHDFCLQGQITKASVFQSPSAHWLARTICSPCDWPSWSRCGAFVAEAEAELQAGCLSCHLDLYSSTSHPAINQTRCPWSPTSRRKSVRNNKKVKERNVPDAVATLRPLEPIIYRPVSIYVSNASAISPVAMN